MAEVRGPLRDPLAVLLVVLGLGCGASPFFFAFYDLSVWGPIALALLAVLVAVAVARPAIPTGPLAVALGGLLLMWLLALVSQGWAQAADRALVDAGRWLLYAAVVGVVVLLARTPRHGALLLGACAAGVVVVAGYEVVRLGFGDGSSLFLGNRLNDPVGYVNGQAGFLLMGVWPLVALAEQRRSAVVSGLAVGAAVVLAGLLLLTEARGAALGVAVSALVVLAAVPGRARRLCILGAGALALAAVARPLLDVYDHGATQGVIQHGVRRLLVAAVVAGVVWTLADLAWTAVAARGAGARRVQGMLVRVAGVVLLVAVVGSAIGFSGRISDRADQQYHAFVDLQGGTSGTSRFLSGAGNRYDYWRIAWKEFKDEPVRGVGAGNFDRDYFRLRRTTEDVRQPHSLELQALSDLGLAGGVALLAILGGIFWAFAGTARAARVDPLDRALAVAAGGTFTAFLAHTTVDWLHLLPGVAGIAFASAGVLLAPWAQAPGQRLRRPVLGVMAAGVVAVAVAGGIPIAQAVLAQHERSVARSLVATDPVGAIDHANRSLARMRSGLETYWVKAAAYARLDRYADARATLFQAARRQPSDFVTWGLIGDLAARRGSATAARSAYARAAALNPRDTTLRDLARRPLLQAPAGG